MHVSSAPGRAHWPPSMRTSSPATRNGRPSTIVGGRPDRSAGSVRSRSSVAGRPRRASASPPVGPMTQRAPWPATRAASALRVLVRAVPTAATRGTIGSTPVRPRHMGVRSCSWTPSPRRAASRHCPSRSTLTD
uniref:Uncharacterized protein n=1 Tax=uncultured Nocardioidaceae bacterium TaxID=253824 RepID=A0A6J4M802_9ACTN|nr:MAG: hypothetical protein AVDCRST_MAG46-2678 [uncultured Nocardioidaceae bacterium]